MSTIRSHKVVIVGDCGVGKSSIVSSLFKKYKDNESSTIGCAFHMYKSKKSKNNLGLWDTAGQERFRSIVRMYFRNVHAVIFVFDLSKEQTFKNLNEWIENVKEIVKSEQFPPLTYIVGAKEDLVSTEIDNVKYINFAEENNSLFFSTSAKLGTNIEELFEEIASDLKNSKNHRISEISSDTSTFYAFGKNISSNFNCCYY